MAKKSTTYKGKPKPLGKSGHFNETRRHQLQGKGIRTGNLSKSMPVPKKEPLLDLGILSDDTHKELAKQTGVSYSYSVGDEKPKEEEPKTEVEKILEEEGVKELQFDEPSVPLTIDVAGAEEIEIEGDEIEIKNPSKGFLSEMFGGFNVERDVRGKSLHRKALTQLGREKELEDFETPDFPSRGAKMGKMLADLFGDYRSEDLVDLNDKELEELAVKYDSHSGGFFGKPQNPFMEELKSRIRSREHIKFEKAKLDAELEPSRIRIQTEIKQMRDRAKAKEKSGGGDIMERLLGF